MTIGTCELCGLLDHALIAGVCPSCRKKFFVTTDAVLAALRNHIGAAHGVSITQLVQEVADVEPAMVCPASERATRKVVEQLRTEGHHICAHPSTGYYIAATPDELDQTCSFLYDRAMTSLKQIAAMKRVSLPDLRGQLHLPT